MFFCNGIVKRYILFFLAAAYGIAFIFFLPAYAEKDNTLSEVETYAEIEENTAQVKEETTYQIEESSSQSEMIDIIAQDEAQTSNAKVEVEVSSETEHNNATSELGEASNTLISEENDGYSELNAAIIGLNYKIELIQSRYIDLSREIEELRDGDRGLKRMIAEERVYMVDPKNVKNLEAKMDILRSEHGQLMEDFSLLKSKTQYNNISSQEKKPFEEIIHSTWFSISSFGVALIALLVAL